MSAPPTSTAASMTTPAPPSAGDDEATTSIMLLHGVGLSPTLFGDVVDLLDTWCATDAGHAPAADHVGHAPRRVVHTPLRRGYRGADDRAAATFDELLADVAELVAAAAPTVLVGVSGGATLALAAAAAGVPGLVAVVAHEPLVGPLVSSLHEVVAASADRLASSNAVRSPLGVDEDAVAFVARLVGADVWARLPHETHAFAARHALTVRCEVPLFVGWRPGRTELERCSVPVVVSTGELSGAPRHDAASLLASTGARPVVIPGAGHLAPWQRPQAFADVVIAACRSVPSPAPHRDATSESTRETTEEIS